MKYEKHLEIELRGGRVKGFTLEILLLQIHYLSCLNTSAKLFCLPLCREDSLYLKLATFRISRSCDCVLSSSVYYAGSEKERKRGNEEKGMYVSFLYFYFSSRQNRRMRRAGGGW